MAVADIVIIVIVVLSILIGIVRGFVRESLSLVSWVLALWVAFNFAGDAGQIFTDYLAEEPLRNAAGFVLLFIGTLLIASVTSFLIHKLFSATGMTGTDRSLGGVFGLVRGVLLIAVLVLLGNVLGVPKQAWWQQSRVIPLVEPIATAVYDILPTNVRTQLGTTR